MNTLNEQDQVTLRIAAWGAVSLMSAAGIAGSAHKVATHGALALSAATGQVGHVLAKAPKSKELKFRTVAELADRVLPALSDSMSLLKAHDPAEAANFRSTVIVALDAAAGVHKGQPSPALTEMARKITAALDLA
ncbi:hypothetical protein [Nonomuraea soli]|uniref:D-alanyl-D-alanine carboxypeptidase n=1 Tax=Nonomuraea soli TaxID=1032476 RepID=A0A7W0CSR8_9ACTN|nr:hypothetical protein [Nonomuraea soli]MBA2896495.1 hypothetical protein [Nonomuraea soli]